MYDFNNFNTNLSRDVHQAAFLKSPRPESWQEAVKHSKKGNIENRLRSLARDNILTNMANALSIHFHQWRQAHHQTSSQMTSLPPQPRSS